MLREVTIYKKIINRKVITKLTVINGIKTVKNISTK